MKDVLIILSGVITIAAALPYLMQVVRGTTKPRVVSWFTWTLISSIASAASFSDHQYPAAILMLCAAIEVGLITVLGLKHGDRKIDALDVVCQIAVLIGLVLWLVFNSPNIAVIATIMVDFVGCIPTFKHSWKKPHEETWLTFALSSLGGLLTVLVAASWKPTAIAYPAYIVVNNVVLVGLIIASPHRHLRGEPAELREL